MEDAWSDSEDLSDEDLDVYDRIKKLKQTILETSSMLDSINQALINQGNPREVLFPKELDKFRPQPGIRIDGKLSFRGQDMAREYYDYLDEDKDGRVSFSDVRACFSLADRKWGFAHQDHFRYWDSWRLFLADEGIATDDDGFISKENFVKMRVLLEPKMPLVHELVLTGLGFLPSTQAKWRLARARTTECILDRDDDPDDDRDLEYLDLNEMSFVTVSSGFVYSEAELMEGMIVRARLEKCLQQLKRKVFKKDYVEDPDKYRSQLLNHGLPPPEDDISRDDIGKPDMRRCKPHNLLAWLHSDGPKPRLPALHQVSSPTLAFALRARTRVHRPTHPHTPNHTPTPPLSCRYNHLQAILYFKYNSFSIIRKLTKLGGFIWDLSLYVKERDLFKDFTPIEAVMIDRKVLHMHHIIYIYIYTTDQSRAGLTSVLLPHRHSHPHPHSQAKKKEKRKQGLVGGAPKPKDDKKKGRNGKPKEPSEKELREEAERKAKQAKVAAMAKAKTTAKAELNVRGTAAVSVEVGDVGEIGEDGTGMSLKVGYLEKMEVTRDLFVGHKTRPDHAPPRPGLENSLALLSNSALNITNHTPHTAPYTLHRASWVRATFQRTVASCVSSSC